MRLLPELTPFNEWFWTSGADGRLRVQRCPDCTTLVHCDPGDVRIGQRVTARFEHDEDVWLPLFTPTGEADAADVPHRGGHLRRGHAGECAPAAQRPVSRRTRP